VGHARLAPTPVFDTSVYGGNTSCVTVKGDGGTMLVLDAGTGIRRLGMTIDPSVGRVDILLTHLHLDHIQASDSSRPCIARTSTCTSGPFEHETGPAHAADALSVAAALFRFV
jgi:phosphoribosyl 1,2-cyclic phosphodiesterase